MGHLAVAALLIGFTLPLCAQGSRASSAQKPAPNIVLIVADDLGYGELSCYGQTKIATPACDRIAKQGLRFTDAHCGAPVCAPSRCVLLTGLDMGRTHVRDNREIQPEGQEPLPRDTVTLGKLLKGAGYATACIGKWGLGGPGSSGAPDQQGFDHFFGYLCQRKAHDHYPQELWRNREQVTLHRKQYAQDLFVAEARDFVTQKHERPFFLLLTPTLPHLALQVPDAALAPYLGKWDETPYDGKKGYRPHPTPYAAYAAMISEFDRGVGAILAALEESGRARDTLVLVTSDNGPTHDVGGVDTSFFASAGPLLGRKGSCYEGGIRVPLLAYWPGRIAPGSVSSHLVAATDYLPTLCELAGVKTPESCSGVSLVPTLTHSGTQREHEFVYWEFPGYGGWQAVRQGPWMAVRKQLAKNPDAPFELYDLEKDLAQTLDVAREHAEIVARAQSIAAKAHVPSREFPFPALDR